MKRAEDVTLEEYYFFPPKAALHNVPYTDRRIVKIRDYILEHYDEDITPQSVIRQFGMKTNHARSMFTFVFGETMSSMLRRLRAEHAVKGAI